MFINLSERIPALPTISGQNPSPLPEPLRFCKGAFHPLYYFPVLTTLSMNFSLQGSPASDTPLTAKYFMHLYIFGLTEQKVSFLTQLKFQLTFSSNHCTFPYDPEGTWADLGSWDLFRHRRDTDNPSFILCFQPINSCSCPYQDDRDGPGLHELLRLFGGSSSCSCHNKIFPRSPPPTLL